MDYTTTQHTKSISERARARDWFHKRGIERNKKLLGYYLIANWASFSFLYASLWVCGFSIRGQFLVAEFGGLEWLLNWWATYGLCFCFPFWTFLKKWIWTMIRVVDRDIHAVFTRAFPLSSKVVLFAAHVRCRKSWDLNRTREFKCAWDTTVVLRFSISHSSIHRLAGNLRLRLDFPIFCSWSWILKFSYPYPLCVFLVRGPLLHETLEFAHRCENGVCPWGIHHLDNSLDRLKGGSCMGKKIQRLHGVACDWMEGEYERKHEISKSKLFVRPSRTSRLRT